MDAWSDGVVHTGLAVGALLLLGQAFVRAIPALGRVGVPSAMVAGALGLGVGPEVLGVVPLRVDVLEQVVYHGLGVTFIALGLRRPDPSAKGRGSKGMALGIGLMFGMQILVGLGCVVALGWAGWSLHPGFGAILPLGFEQGPGQALSMGAAWEAGGMPDGAQVGLIMAALGFGWALVAGVPLVAWGRRRWGVEAASDGPLVEADEPEPTASGGDLEPLSAHLAAIAAIYAATWAVCVGLAAAFSFAPDLVPVVWGFHFMFGALVALVVRRPVVERLRLSERWLGRIAGLAVDVSTVAALAAIQIGVVRAHAVPIAVVSTVGGLATVALSVGTATRLFPRQTLAHVAVLFGMATGTTPTGLALLRMIDPEMRSGAAAAAVGGSALAVPVVAPMLLGILPVAISGRVGLACALTVGWGVVPLVCGRVFGAWK